MRRLTSLTLLIGAAILVTGFVFTRHDQEAPKKEMPSKIDASTPKDIQIELALQAAPKEVSSNATIWILGKAGYEKVREGTNGFNCLISRERMDTMEPECFDAETSATSMQVTLFQEAERAKGKSEEAIDKEIEAGYKSGKFKAPSKAGIIYMMSDHNYVLNPGTGKIIRFPGHYMFPAPYITYKDLGSPNGKGVPYIVAEGKPNALVIVVPRH